MSQRLVSKADGKGRVPAVEVLVNTGRVFDRIADPDHTDSIVDVIAEGEYYGMQTFDQALVQLVKEGLVTVEDARRDRDQPARLRPAARRRDGSARRAYDDGRPPSRPF